MLPEINRQEKNCSSCLQPQNKHWLRTKVPVVGKQRTWESQSPSTLSMKPHTALFCPPFKFFNEMKKISIFTRTQVGSNLTDLQTLIQADAWWVSVASVTCFQVLTTLGCPGQEHRQPACTWHFCLGLTSCPFLSGLTSAHSSTVSQLSNTCVSHQSCLGSGGSKSPV